MVYSTKDVRTPYNLLGLLAWLGWGCLHTSVACQGCVIWLTGDHKRGSILATAVWTAALLARVELAALLAGLWRLQRCLLGYTACSVVF